MRKIHLYVMVFWVALGLFMSVWSYARLGIGKFHAPGTGFMPFLLGILFCFLAFIQIIKVIFTPADKHAETTLNQEQVLRSLNYNKLLLVITAMFGFALLIEPLGFLITTFFTMMVLFRCAGFSRWTIAAVCAALVTLITYFLFTYLGVRFPPGILRAFGLN